MTKLRLQAAARAAERFLEEQGVEAIPVDPAELAGRLGIEVIPKPDTVHGVSGMLLAIDGEFVIVYATHIQSEGFQRFSIAHELGHYLLEGHAEHLLASGRHESKAGFGSKDPYELEADHFAARLLMPNPAFAKAVKAAGEGLPAVERLAAQCRTSTTATAIRYVQECGLPVAVVVSSGPTIEYAFLSDELKEFRDIDWPKKGSPLNKNVATAAFNRDPMNIETSRRLEVDTELMDWFGGAATVAMTEESVGLGSYGKTLTILTAERFADDDDDEDVEDEPRFR